MAISRRTRSLALIVAVGGLVAGCGSSSPPVAAPPTSTPSTTAPPTTVAPTTTTVYAPSAPQPSGADAASRLVSAWESGSPTEAATVAAPAAVQALFAVPYARGYIQFRSCGQVPLTCTYANRSSAAGALYNIVVVQTVAGGWFAQSVAVEQ